VEFWNGASQLDFFVLRVLADNSGKAPLLKWALKGNIRLALEEAVDPSAWA
jgi:hypothetical protein